MADETRTANVVLTADVDQYKKGTDEAIKETNKLTESVNKLVSSLDGITKRAGKKLLLFTAADVAALTGYVAVAAKYEKQLATLNAQVAISGRSIDAYRKGINQLTKDIPATRGEMVGLVTAINQLGVTSEKQTIAMARTFKNLSAATGEDLGALTTGMIELSRQMGTLGSGDLSGFADSLTTVSNNAGVSATSILNFAQSISPFARAAGIGQKELLGISTAFTKAGADGYAAANTFNSMLSDITRQVQTGSPAIAKYSNTIGVTVEQFKEMDSTERIVQLFESIGDAGPDAIKVLDRLGYDGIRAAKSIQAVANEQGGLRKAIEESVGAFGQGATQTGASKAYDTLDARMTKVGTNLEKMGAAIGEGVMPFAKALLDVFNKILEVTNQVAAPLLSLAGTLGTLLAPLTGAAGALLTMLGPLSTAMVAMTAFRLSPMRSMLSGIRTGIGRGDPLRTEAVGAMRGPWYMRQPYIAGVGAGRALGNIPGVVPTAGGAVGRVGPITRIGGALLAENRMGLSAAQLATGSAMLYRNAGMRDWWNRQSMIGNATVAAGGFLGRTREGLSAAVRDPRGFLTGLRDSGGAQEATKQAKAFSTAMAAGTTATLANNTAKTANTTATAANTVSTRSLAASAGVATRAIIGMQLAAAKFGVQIAAQGIGAVGKGALGMIGGLVGLSGTAGVVAGGVAVAGAAGYAMVNRQRDLSTKSIINEDTQRNLAITNDALGLPTEKLSEFANSTNASISSQNKYKSVTEAMIETIKSANAAIGDYTDSRVSELRNQDQAVAFLQSMGEMNPQQAASLASDIKKRFGAGGQGIIDRYLEETGGGTGETFDYRAINRMSSGAIQTQSENYGFLWQSRWFTSEAAAEQINTMFVGALEAANAQSVSKHGETAVNRTMGNYINEMLVNAFDYQPEVAGSGFGMGVAKTQEQLIKQIEAYFGAEGGFFTTPLGIKPSVGGGYYTSAEDIFKDLFNEENTSDLAVRFRDWARNSGITAQDFEGQGAAGIAVKARLSTTGENLSAYERAVRGIGLGQFARENADIAAVTEGTDIGNPIAVQRAIDLLAVEAQRGGRSLGDMAVEFQRLKQAVGDAEDPLYQLANAAAAAVRQQMMYTAQANEGSLGAMQARVGYNQAILNTPVSTEEGAQEWTQAAQDMIAARTELRGQIAQYNQMLFQANKAQDRAEDDYNRQRDLANRDRERSILLSEQDFYRSRIRATEDFARSMRRAAEDASKSFFNPYERLAAQQTVSSATLAANGREQMQALKNIPKNLNLLRRLGVSQTVIDTLNLTDPSMFQQLQALVDEGTGLDVTGLNRSYGSGRINAASNVLSEQQTTRRGEEDFARQMKRSDDDFKLSLDRAAESFQISMDDMATSFQISKDRTAEDIADYGREVTGTIEQIMADTTQILFDDLGMKTNEYHERLLKYLDIPGITDEEMPTMPRVLEGSGSPAEESLPNTNNPLTALPGFEFDPTGGVPMVYSSSGYGQSVVPEDAKSTRVSGYQYVPTGVGPSSTTINKNNIWHGPVTVMADDPDAMARALAEKSRLANLRKGESASVG